MIKKLIKRWDSERELFYDDIRHVLQSTIDLRQNYGTYNVIQKHKSTIKHTMTHKKIVGPK